MPTSNLQIELLWENGYPSVVWTAGEGSEESWPIELLVDTNFNFQTGEEKPIFLIPIQVSYSLSLPIRHGRLVLKRRFAAKTQGAPFPTSARAAMELELAACAFFWESAYHI